MSRVLKNKTNEITQNYKKGFHDGIDLVGYKNALDYVIAHSDGVVVSVRNDYKTIDKTGISYGNYVKIKHNNGYYTLYAHLKQESITVKVGDKVSKGEVIGFMGATGHTDGAHLHFEVRDDKDIQIDPTQYIDKELPKSILKQKLYLPKTALTWRVYPLNKAPIVGNERGLLLPSKFNGLEYDILGWSIPNTVAIIETRDFGKVQIYVGKDTKAYIK